MASLHSTVVKDLEGDVPGSKYDNGGELTEIKKVHSAGVDSWKGISKVYKEVRKMILIESSQRPRVCVKFSWHVSSLDGYNKLQTWRSDLEELHKNSPQEARVQLPVGSGSVVKRRDDDELICCTHAVPEPEAEPVAT